MYGAVSTTVESAGVRLSEISNPAIALHASCVPSSSAAAAEFQFEHACEFSVMAHDEPEALAGLMHARLSILAARMGEILHYQATRALAERLSRPPSMTYSEFVELYGDSRRARAVLESLGRVGLLFDAGNSVIMPAVPVALHLLVEGDGEHEFERVCHGNTPVLGCRGKSVRVVASGRMALELRVYRVAHGTDGTVKRRSITRASLTRGRATILDFEPFDLADAHVEQLLLHVSWPQNGGSDEERDGECCAPESEAQGDTLVVSLENERHGLVASAGPGWMVEYLVPRDA